MAGASCQICNIGIGKYSCPKCNIFYCSVNCYQSEIHLQCSEAFYEQCVIEELKKCEMGPAEKKKMLEILKENQQDDSDESLDSDDLESEPDLATRMLDLDLDDEKCIWEKLTADEKKEFRKLVATGDIINIIPDREPWWKILKKNLLIQESSADKFDYKKICPALPPKIPDLATLTKIQPSPNIAHMVLNILASYTCVVRWFKGTYMEMPVESISTCIALSGTLRNNAVYSNPIEAFMSFEDDFSKCKWLKEVKYDSNLVNEDLKDIITGIIQNDKYYCIKAALSDLDLIITKAIHALQECKTLHLKRFTGATPDLHLLHLLSRKMTYYLSWTLSYGNLLIDSIKTLIS